MRGPVGPQPLHWRPDFGGSGGHGKEIVVGAVQRKGNVVARVIDSADSETLNRFVAETVSHRVSLVSTDDHRGYRYLDKHFPHDIVHHGEGVHGNIHTQTIEGFWSLVKRAIIGTFHKVSRKYLPFHVNEFEFRYNNRMNLDIFGAAIRAC